MRDVSLKQRIPCIIRISILKAFSAEKSTHYTRVYIYRNAYWIECHCSSALFQKVHQLSLIKTLIFLIPKLIYFNSGNLHPKNFSYLVVDSMLHHFLVLSSLNRVKFFNFINCFLIILSRRNDPKYDLITIRSHTKKKRSQHFSGSKINKSL